MPRATREGDRYEDDLHVRVATYLDHVLPRTGPDRCVWWHTPNGARYDPAKAASTASLLAMMGLRPGIPDILLLHRGRLFGCELKSVTGAATKDQVTVCGDLNAAGATIADPRTSPVRTVEEMESLLIDWGIPLNFCYRDLRTKHIMKPAEATAMTAIAQADKGLKARRSARFRRKTSAKFHAAT